MIRFLVIQVMLGKITIEQVPEKFRRAVREELSEE